MTTIIRRAQLTPSEGKPVVTVEGENVGASVSFVAGDTDKVGAGPPLHRHPYDEIHIVREGKVRYYVDGDEFEADAGDIVVIPAGAVHTLVTLGPGRTSDIGVHLAPRSEVEVLGPPPDI